MYSFFTRLLFRPSKWRVFAAAAWLCLTLSACRSPESFREQADEASQGIIREKQLEALGRTEDFSIEQAAETLRERLLIDQKLPKSGQASLGADSLEPTEHWPEEEDYLDGEREGRPTAAHVDLGEGIVPFIGLNEALQIAARNNRDYQTRKENVFRTALALDLQRDAFRPIFATPAEAGLDGQGTNLGNVANAGQSAVGQVSQRLTQGAVLTSRIAVDLTQLLTQEGGSALGLLADASVEVPLLRGAGRWIVTEPLNQAERDAVYAIYNFERFKRTFAVDVASNYLGVLRLLDQVDNAEENYRRLVTSSRRAQALAEEGRLPEIQVDQALQDELRARNGWISAQQGFAAGLDGLKLLLGLPADAEISLDRDTLGRLADSVKAELPALANELLK